MTPTRTLKILACSVIAVGLSTGIAHSGEGKDCDKKYETTAMKTEAAAPNATAVLDASAEKSKAAHAPLTVEQATAKCKKYGADDIDACVAKKMEKYGPKS